MYAWTANRLRMEENCCFTPHLGREIVDGHAVERAAVAGARPTSCGHVVCPTNVVAVIKRKPRPLFGSPPESEVWLSYESDASLISVMI